MYSTVEQLDGCKYPLKIIIVPLLLKELPKQWMNARSLVKIIAVSFKEWVTATLSVTKTDTLLQRMPKRAVPKKVTILSK